MVLGESNPGGNSSDGVDLTNRSSLEFEYLESVTVAIDSNFIHTLSIIYVTSLSHNYYYLHSPVSMNFVVLLLNVTPAISDDCI